MNNQTDVKTSHELNTNAKQYSDIAQYKTSDIGLASTMILKGKKLLYMEPCNTNKKWRSDIFQFVFEKTEDIDELIMQYSTNDVKLCVTPNAFRSTLKYLKEQTSNAGRQ